MASTSPTVGRPAPSFSTEGVQLVDGTAVRSRYDLAERPAGSGPLVLAFYPGDETLVCTRQMCAYSSGLDTFRDLGAQVWGISPQDLDSHEKFARKHDLRLPLLADSDKTVARAYGVLRLGGLHLARSVFVLDGDGVLRWRHVSALGLTYQDTDALATVLRGLAPAA